MTHQDINIQGTRYSMKFSHGILASSLLRAGMGPVESNEFAEHIRELLIATRQSNITETALSELVIQELDRQDLKKISDYYSVWNQIRNQRLGIVILIGGITGIGKSTVAKEVSHRLGINNLIGTDSIREIMRKTISPQLIPELHESTFTAHKHIDIHPMLNNVIVGFERQSRLVSVGIDGMCERSHTEGVNFVIKGIHLVPGCYNKAPNVFPYVLHMENIKAHDHFDTIVNIQRYIKTQAKEYDVSVIEHSSIEESIDTIVEMTIAGVRDMLNSKKKPL